MATTISVCLSACLSVCLYVFFCLSVRPLHSRHQLGQDVIRNDMRSSSSSVCVVAECEAINSISAAPYCTAVYCTVLYCTVLYCSALCCTVTSAMDSLRGLIQQALIRPVIDHFMLSSMTRLSSLERSPRSALNSKTFNPTSMYFLSK